jgi:hypothetical protein
VRGERRYPSMCTVVKTRLQTSKSHVQPPQHRLNSVMVHDRRQGVFGFIKVLW